MDNDLHGTYDGIALESELWSESVGHSIITGRGWTMARLDVTVWWRPVADVVPGLAWVYQQLSINVTAITLVLCELWRKHAAAANMVRFGLDNGLVPNERFIISDDSSLMILHAKRTLEIFVKCLIEEDSC